MADGRGGFESKGAVERRFCPVQLFSLAREGDTTMRRAMDLFRGRVSRRGRSFNARAYGSRDQTTGLNMHATGPPINYRSDESGGCVQI